VSRDSSSDSGALTYPGAAGIQQRRLSDEEIRQVLRDAAELQVGQGVAGGLTVGELRSVAAEAGIEPGFVDVAVAALASSPAQKGVGRLAGRTHWHRRRLVPGVVALENLDRILHVVRATFGEEGKLNLISGRLEWTSTWVVLGVTGRGSATEIDLVADQSIPHAITHLGLPLVGVILGAIVGAAFGAMGFATLALVGLGGVGGHVVARRAWSRYAHAYQAKLDARLERVATETLAQAR